MKRQEGSQTYPEDENEVEPLIIDRGPYFDKSASKNVTALVGKTVHLGCRVRNLANRTVSRVFFSSFLFLSKTIVRHELFISHKGC